MSKKNVRVPWWSMPPKIILGVVETGLPIPSSFRMTFDPEYSVLVKCENCINYYNTPKKRGCLYNDSFCEAGLPNTKKFRIIPHKEIFCKFYYSREAPAELKPWPEKDLHELVTGLGIVEKYKGRYCVTHKFKDFFKDPSHRQKTSDLANRVLLFNPDISNDTASLMGIVLAWNNNISPEEATEVTRFLKYWTKYGVCPLDNYRSNTIHPEVRKC